MNELDKKRVFAPDETVEPEPVSDQFPVVAEKPKPEPPKPTESCPEELQAICKVVPVDGVVQVARPQHVELARAELDRIGKKTVRVDCHNKSNHHTWTR